MIREDVTDTLSRNVGKILPVEAKRYLKCERYFVPKPRLDITTIGQKILVVTNNLSRNVGKILPLKAINTENVTHNLSRNVGKLLPPNAKSHLKI
jgi:hypothetical protein